MHEISSIVLAAGKGTRMKSVRPKVLHTLAGRPMLGWVVDALAKAGVDHGTVVLSDELDSFEPFLAAHPKLNVAIQEARQGTGDAVAAAAFAHADVERPPFARGRLHRGSKLSSKAVVICAGDTPALDPTTLARFIEECSASNAAVGVLGMRVPDPKGYGRCVTQDGQLLAIVEERDATPEQRRIDVCNSGVIWARTAELFRVLGTLTPSNAQAEYYLTDCVAMARKAGLATTVVITDDWESFAGVNDRRQLAEVETVLVRRALFALMASGVTIRLPDTVYMEPQVVCGPDTEIEPHVHVAGATTIGAGCLIGSGARLDGVRVGDGAKIGPGCVLTGGRVGSGERVPPLSVRIA
jgi:bifunctional UDP-N-acetylglucosamine pyrophosphorylase/glucosamine-1-phosphate N-acetyltransferase